MCVYWVLKGKSTNRPRFEFARVAPEVSVGVLDTPHSQSLQSPRQLCFVFRIRLSLVCKRLCFLGSSNAPLGSRFTLATTRWRCADSFRDFRRSFLEIWLLIDFRKSERISDCRWTMPPRLHPEMLMLLLYTVRHPNESEKWSCLHGWCLSFGV